MDTARVPPRAGCRKMSNFSLCPGQSWPRSAPCPNTPPAHFGHAEFSFSPNFPRAGLERGVQEPRGCPAPWGTLRPAPPEHPPAGGCQPGGGGTASPGARPPRGAAAGWRGARPRPFPAARQPGSHSWDSCELCCWRRERSPLCGQAAAGTTGWAGHAARPPAPGSGPGTAREQLHAAPSPNGMVFVGARRGRGLAGGKSFIGHPLRTEPLPAAEAAVTTHRAAPTRTALAAAQPTLTLGYSQTGRGTGAKPEGSEAKEHGRDERGLSRARTEVTAPGNAGRAPT